MAFSCSATASTWLVGTNRNVGSLSMNRLISHGHAMRSTRARSRVTHFIQDLLCDLASAVGEIEGRLQTLRQLRRIVIGPEVHVEESRRVEEPVIVDRGHLRTWLPGRPGRGISFLAGR